MNTDDINLQVHNLPAVVMFECQLPENLVNDLNEYLDEYKEDPDRKSLSHTLVGQIHHGEQLLMDHKHELLTDYYKFLTAMGATYIDTYCKITGAQF